MEGRNRVIVIQEILSSASWRFIPGKDNPADCVSRGLSAYEIERQSSWWLGPSWLSQASVHWPKWNPIKSAELDLEENPKNVLTSVRDQVLGRLLTKYPSLSRLIRITAICKRVIKSYPSRVSGQLSILDMSDNNLISSIKKLAREGRLFKLFNQTYTPS